MSDGTHPVGLTQPAAEERLVGCRAPVASARVARCDYTLWASWGCGITAAVLLAAGIALYRADGARGGGQTPGPRAARLSAPAAKSIVQLREEFDDLVRRNDVREISLAEFSRRVEAILGDCRALLARQGLPEANAIHAQKLLADGYGAVAEYGKEFTAYVAFAERLARYYSDRPQELDGRKRMGLADGEHVLLSLLLHKGDDAMQTGQHLQAIEYFAELGRRFPKSDHAAYGYYRIAQCYIKYDLPQDAEVCKRVLLSDYPGTYWAIPLLHEQARHILARPRTIKEAVGIYVRIASLSRDQEEAFSARLIAAALLVQDGEYGRAEDIMSQSMHSAQSDAQRQSVMRLRAYARAAAFPMETLLEIALP